MVGLHEVVTDLLLSVMSWVHVLRAVQFIIIIKPVFSYYLRPEDKRSFWGELFGGAQERHPSTVNLPDYLGEILGTREF